MAETYEDTHIPHNVEGCMKLRIEVELSGPLIDEMLGKTTYLHLCFLANLVQIFIPNGRRGEERGFSYKCCRHASRNNTMSPTKQLPYYRALIDPRVSFKCWLPLH